MRDLTKNDAPRYLKAVSLAVLGLGIQGAALAQTAAPAGMPAPAEASRPVDINEYVVRGNTVLDARAIETAVTPFLGPQKTMKDIEGARDALLAAYQAKGYQSVYVDLPEQQVTNGVVLLQVSETKVGRVRVVGAQYNSPSEIREQVPALKEGEVPDFNQAQSELTALNRSPKRQVMPLVRQGQLPGTMDVDLKVDDSTPWRASVGLNNDYSPDTKPLRFNATIGNDNLWQLGHSLSLSFVGAPQDMSQSKVFSGSYVAPLRGSDWSLEVDAYKSDSNIATLGGTNVLGKGHSIGLKANYTVPDTGNWWHSFGIGLDFKQSDEALSLGATADSVPLKYAPITLEYQGFLQTERGQYGLDLSLVSGTRSLFGYGSNWREFDNKRYKSPGYFLALKGDGNATYSFADDIQLFVRLAGQMTDSPLVSAEQLAGGGMNSVRGYLAVEAVGDYGAVGSVELRSPPLTFLGSNIQNWRAYVFADAARLRLREALEEQQDSFTLASVGLGTSFRVGERLSGRLDLGYPLKAGPRTERHDARLNFSINASY
ncbi:ShlB/FhaC/HecB family hemolysin secretion/activation protein [Pigmentiphaga soli]|uniref:ShlB/FhaC/HecB family hemolysin secretion/activation protein n=1 Tax=Pigmentiphaga soli TaxID=1007095 RepID=A0ABP8GD38_9BURK